MIATGGQAHLIVDRLALPEDRGRAHHPRRPADDLGAESSCVLNYFNYFTEIEEHFQRARGTSLFLLVPARLGAGGELEERRSPARSRPPRHR